MTITEAYESKNWAELIKALEEITKDTDNFITEYSGGREVRDEQVGNRPDKETDEGPVSVNRLPVQFQKKIVRLASSFLFGNPVHLEVGSDDTDPDSAGEDEANEDFVAFNRLWKKLRLDSHLLKLVEKVKSETEAAILFRAVADGVTQEEDEGIDIKLKVSLLGGADVSLMPGFNEFGDMIVFGYNITVKNAEGKDVPRYYIYDATNVIILEQDGDTLSEIEGSGATHFFNRIPVVYVSQAEPEWYDVKELIDRYEMHLSKFADTNDYFASPFFKAVGNVDSPPKKDDSGKVFMLDVITTDKGQILQSDLDVVSWEQATDATELEFEEVKGLIHALTDTPDLSFDKVKGLGNISGVALELMFLAPILKAKFSEGTYRTVVERVINVLRAGMVYATKEASPAFFETQIDINFRSVLPTNLAELISTLSEATFNKPVMSQETAVRNNPMVKNARKELEMLELEKGSLGESGNLGPTGIE